MSDKSEIIIYQTENGLTKIDVRLEDDTVWLTQAEMAELFQKMYQPYHGIYRTFLKKENYRRAKAICVFCKLQILINRLLYIA